jgi:hypothetical protein
LKSIDKHYKVAFIKKGKDAIDVASNLHPNFVQTIRTLNVFEKLFRNKPDNFYELQNPVYLLLDSGFC